jgi:signal transduction histidine kinase
MANRFTSERVIAALLLGLVGLTAGLVFQARSIERSHRATADNALRDYAALAAWQYTERIQTELSSMSHTALDPVHELIHADAGGVMLPAPDVLLADRKDECSLVKAARFAFRVDLGGPAFFAGTVPDRGTKERIAARMTELAAAAPTTGEVLHLLVDSIGGERRAIAFGVVRRAGRAVSVYGLESPADAILPHLQHPFRHKALLPPSLLRGRTVDSVLTLVVHAPDGAPLAALGDTASMPGALMASTTSNAQSGSLTASVTIRPSAAGTLLIGGAPTSRLPLLLAFLVGSMLLAGLALIQVRRGRELARLRTRFVANVSHELRTPLAQISMFSETLLLGRERSREEAREFLSVIFREARRLSHLVESVLSFSRGEAGPQVPTKLAPLDVSYEVGEALHAFTPIAAAAGMTLSADLDANAIAAGNAHAMRQVLINLLDNAVKFGAAGQTIAVTVRRSEDGVVLAVDDEGPGIPLEERRRVFEPFAQGTSGSTRGQSGAGIGLTVVAELMRAMGGRVWIDDAPAGTGARIACALR